METQDKSYEATDFGWLIAMSFVFLALVAIALWREAFPSWRPIQKTFRTTLQKYAGVEKADAFQSGIKQIWIPKINVVDRCVTCHLGYDWGTLLPASLGEPLMPHPDLPYMDQHPFQQFGCTTCHGGQGWATTAEAAHGDKIGTIRCCRRPSRRAMGFRRGELMQMRCNFCHRHDVATPGMDQINEAKQLLKKKKCLVCHTVEGRGGATAPEITYFGDKDPELVDFTHVTGERTLFNWNYQHLMAPDVVSPHTVMPTFNFTPDQARDLTLLLLSWRREIFPPEYIPAPIEGLPSPEASPSAAPSPAAASKPL